MCTKSQYLYIGASTGTHSVCVCVCGCEKKETQLSCFSNKHPSQVEENTMCQLLTMYYTLQEEIRDSHMI